MQRKSTRRGFLAACSLVGGALCAVPHSASHLFGSPSPPVVPEEPGVIPGSAYQRRLGLVQGELAKRDTGALVLFSLVGYDTRYLSGHAPGILLVPAEGPPTLFAIARAQTWITDVRSAPDNDQLVDKCAARLKELRLESAKIALGGDLEWALKAKLGNALPSARWQAGNEIQDQFRLIKDEYELASLRLSQQVADAEIRAGQKAIRPGRSDRDVFADMVQAGIRQGAMSDSCRHFIGYGPGTDDLWSPLSGRQIKSGEVVNFEGIIYHGHYNIETPVTFAVGKVSAKQKEIAGINFDAFQAGIAAMKPGASVGSVVEASSKVLKAHGFDKMIRGFGHFIGLANNDRPSFADATKNELALQPGMTLSYHTTITVPTKEAIAIVGSVVLITKDGKELLTKIEPKPMQETA